jgi:hypothetical protein
VLRRPTSQCPRRQRCGWDALGVAVSCLLSTLSSCVLGSCVLSSCVSREKPAKKQELSVETQAARACPYAGRVNQDITLTKACSPYQQPGGGIDVIDGATLTIEAGVELRFSGTDWLEVGAGGEPGRMIAKGTPQEPILFTFGSPEPTWLGVWFHSGTLPGSVLSNAVIRGAGGDNRHSKPNLLMGCLTLTGVKPGALSIDALTVQNCRNGGVRMNNSHVQLGALSFVDTTQGYVLDAQSVGNLSAAAQYRGVTHNLLLGGTVAEDARWLAQAVPYFVEGDIQVQGPSSPALTLEAGTDLRFAQGSGLLVGAEQPGTLRVAGSPEAPVKLSAKQPGEAWNGVRFLDHTSSGTRVAYAQVSDTSGQGAVVLSSKAGHVEIVESSFSNNATDVLLGCGAKLVAGNNRYASPHGLTRKAPCPSAKAR